MVDNTTCPSFADAAEFTPLGGVDQPVYEAGVWPLGDSLASRVEVFDDWGSVEARLADLGAPAVTEHDEIDWSTTRIALAWSHGGFGCIWGTYVQGVHEGGFVEYVDYHSCCAGDTADLANTTVAFLLVVPRADLEVCRREWLCDGPSGCAEAPAFIPRHR